MKGLSAAIWVESLKVHRSAILWITLAVFAFIAIMTGLFVYLARHPELIGNSAILSVKTSVLSVADWPAYFILLQQMVAALGMIGFGFVFSWVYGREYSDRTIKDLLALPVPRSTIVIAKLIIASIWCILLTIILFVFGVISGKIVGMTGWSESLLWHSCKIFSLTALLTIILSTPVAFFASAGRGYLVPIGYLILLMILTQFVVASIPTVAPYLPWAIPALSSGAAGPESAHLGIISYLILIFTGIAGLIGTLAWWRYADQT